MDIRVFTQCNTLFLQSLRFFLDHQVTLEHSKKYLFDYNNISYCIEFGSTPMHKFMTYANN